MTKTKAKREPTYLLDCVLPPTDVTADGFLAKHSLDQLLFWTAADLEVKLSDFKRYYNEYRIHASLKVQTPIPTPEAKGVNFKSYRWQKHCRGLYQTPMAA
jgi:putative transposase